MGLKIAKFRIVDRFGRSENCLLSWSGADINYGKAGSIRFAVFENEAEYARNNQKDTFVLPISAEEVLAMFQRVGNVALEISDASWDLAQSTKFITSRVEDSETGTITFEQFSLTDLQADIIDVGIPGELKA